MLKAFDAGDKHSLAEGQILSWLCERAASSQPPLVDRIPWTSTPVEVQTSSFRGPKPASRAHRLTLILQQRLDGFRFSTMSGTTFFDALFFMIASYTRRRADKADGEVWNKLKHAARRCAADLLRWDRFIQSQQLFVADLQFMLSPAGGVSIFDVSAVSVLPNASASIVAQHLPVRSTLMSEAARRRLRQASKSNEFVWEAYGVQRQRVALLTFSIAASLVAEGPGGLRLLESELCSELACEFGCVYIQQVQEQIRGRLLRTNSSTFVATRAVRLLDELVGTPPSPYKRSARQHNSHAQSYSMKVSREAPGILPTRLCGACAARADVYSSSYNQLCKGDPNRGMFEGSFA